MCISGTKRWVFLAYTILFLVGCALPRSGSSQDSIAYPRADNLVAHIKGSAAALGGDTIKMTYAVSNDPASVQRVEYVLVTGTALPLGRMDKPGRGWAADHGVLEDSSLAVTWLATGPRKVLPGDSAAPLSYTALGLVGITRFYVQGFVDIADLYSEQEAERVKAPLSILEDSYKGWTIAVVPFPANMTPLALTQRLEALTDQACELGWIAEPGICNSLEAKQRAARRAIQNGNLPTACNNINALVNEVNALADSKIKPEARALLRLNAQHFLRTHCGA